MSLYNMLFGVNKIAPVLIKILDLDIKDTYIGYNVGRFRDIYLNEDGTKIILYTRNGGGNRDCWGDGEENCNCPGCIITYQLPKHPNYVKDWDDEFDCTYAYVEFNVPERYKELCKVFATGIKEKTVSEKFDELIKEIKTMSKEEIESDKRFSSTIDLLNKILGDINV